MENRLHDLENADERIADLKQALQTVAEENNALCHEITTARKKYAHEFSKLVTRQLRSLNMPKAEL